MCRLIEVLLGLEKGSPDNRKVYVHLVDIDEVHRVVRIREREGKIFLEVKK